MIIKRIAVGNEKEAFVESSLQNNINVISSDDNNKGKTIIMQSMMYCLGNVPTFPSSFDYKSYFHYIEFVHNNCDYTICRKGDVFVIFHENNLMFFDSVSEMKRYWTKNIFALPEIIKNSVSRIVDPELFVQLYFIGQDKKDTSNIANKGFYTKDDFVNMIYAYAGLGVAGLTTDEILIKKKQVDTLKEEKKALLKQHRILKNSHTSSAYLSQHNDRAILESTIKDIEKIRDNISTLRTSRNSNINRKLKHEVTLKELNSLNRTMDCGELRCLDCNSVHIGFAASVNASYTFDISTPEIRQQIISSINEKIAAYDEEIERITLDINKEQERLKQILADDEISLESIVIHKQEILDATGVEARLSEIDSELQKLADALKSNETNTSDRVEKQRTLLSSILKEMNSAYKEIDPTGTLIFESLFTKRDQVFSGSEATEFHLVKLYAISKVLGLTYPIIVDSFRAEDLSSERENTVIELFARLEKQVIFTTTLKIEEANKYQLMGNINNIDYSKNAPSKILNEHCVVEFISLLKELSITI